MLIRSFPQNKPIFEWKWELPTGNRPILRVSSKKCKVGCVLPRVAVSILPDVEFGPNDHCDDTTYFTNVCHCTYICFDFIVVAFSKKIFLFQSNLDGWWFDSVCLKTVFISLEGFTLCFARNILKVCQNIVWSLFEVLQIGDALALISYSRINCSRKKENTCTWSESIKDQFRTG